MDALGLVYQVFLLGLFVDLLFLSAPALGSWIAASGPSRSLHRHTGSSLWAEMKSRPWSGGRLPLTSLERRPHTSDELQDRLAVRRGSRFGRCPGPVPSGGSFRSFPGVRIRIVVRGSGSLAIEVLQEMVGSEFDLLVSPLRGSVLAGDQAGSVHSPEVAVDEAVPGLDVPTCTFGQSEESLGGVFR
jgi:hypothetical protein